MRYDEEELVAEWPHVHSELHKVLSSSRTHSELRKMFNSSRAHEWQSISSYL